MPNLFNDAASVGVLGLFIFVLLWGAVYAIPREIAQVHCGHAVCDRGGK